jgi:LDH2 family malate/lactate/ureidoglycolate dehydrogenase
VANGQPVTRIPLATFHTFCCKALQSVGVPADAAALVADSLTQSDARGLASHGVVRLLPVYIRRLQTGSTRPRPDIRVTRPRDNVALVAGDAGLGQVVGHRAMEIAIGLARTSGVGVVGARDSSHFGAAAFFLKQAVEADMVAFVMTNAPANMPPYGGRKPFFGTNPLAVGLPCGSEPPVLLDMSTSVVAKGKIIIDHKNGQHEIPLGWAIDEAGHPTTSAEAAIRGAVLPMGGHKGSGLALVIDALCGVLTGAAFGPHIIHLYDEGDQAQNVGHFFMALDIETFMPIAMFKARMDQFVQEIRSQPRQPGVERIFVPGEIEHEREEESRKKGIPLSEAGRRELDELAERLGIVSLTALLS